jgi:hypothetical protein
MVTKHDCLDVFNAMIKGTPVSFDKKLFPIVSEYLTEINYENSDKMINLIVQNPQIVQRFIPELVEYYCKKYNILRLQLKPNSNSINFNLKTILYYE